MANLPGHVRIRILRGINLAVRDTFSSDPYVVLSTGHQRLKTRVVKSNCNPEWNEEFTLTIKDPNVQINLTVFDKDRFTRDDKMGEAAIGVKDLLDCLGMGLSNLPTPTTISRVQPSKENYLAEESCIVWNNGKIVQEMRLRLTNVECGEVEIQLEWIKVSSFKGY